jgi:hypothetical protein
MSFGSKVQKHGVEEKLANKVPIDFLEIPASSTCLGPFRYINSGSTLSKALLVAA